MSDMITFKYLREIQKKERSGSELCRLDEGFYEAVSDYILRKKRIRDKGKGLSFSEKKEIENIGPVVKSIYDTRETKIVNGALKAARTGIKIVNVLPCEMKLFEEVKSRIMDSRTALETVLRPKKESDSVNESAPAQDSNTSNISQIRIIEDIPEFVGEDLKSYGPWKAGEDVMCPKSFADIFIKGGKAEDAEG